MKASKCQSKNPASCVSPRCPDRRAFFGMIPKPHSKVKTPEKAPESVSEAPLAGFERVPLDDEVTSERKHVFRSEWAHHWFHADGEAVVFAKTRLHDDDDSFMPGALVLCDLESRHQKKGLARSAILRLMEDYGKEKVYITGTVTKQGLKFVRNNRDILELMKEDHRELTFDNLESSVSPMSFVHDWDKKHSEFNL